MPKKVLIVDDEPEVADILRDVAESKGFEAYTAANGLEGLVAVESYNPDGVFTDFNMPVLDGLGMAKRLRESGYRGPIHMVSADTGPDYFSDEFRDAMARYGIDENMLPQYVTSFVKKPNIIEPIMRILSGQAQEQ